jgi:thiosulfate/3-mercaptopyruvate sulfurtransferase
VVIDARSKEAYAKGHILGAVHSNSDEWQDTNALPHCLILREKIRKICQEIGIHGDSLVVLYDDDDGRLAARIWFTLHAYGHEKVAILNGGVAQWLGDLKDESKGWSVELVKPTEVGTFEPNEKLRGVVGFNELPQFKLRVQELGKLPAITLIDARSLAEYMGDDVRGKASGHIPGAANLEWSAVMVGKEHLRRWRSPPEIHAILRVGGIDGTQRIAVYDQAGGRSSHLYFTLWLMGFEKLHNYTAGWREYGNKDGVEIEK